jgi:hypothetical protein
MRDWFKYEFGFVNLDDDYIYLTSSGNWSDTKKLKEYKKTVKNLLPSKDAVFLAIVLIAFIAIIILNISKGKISILLLIGLPITAYAVYNYMKSGVGEKYLIPIRKINSIQFSGNVISISFNDLNNLDATCELKKVSDDGLEIMKLLQNNLGS